MHTKLVTTSIAESVVRRHEVALVLILSILVISSILISVGVVELYAITLSILLSGLINLILIIN